MDAAVSVERQEYIFDILLNILYAKFELKTKADARQYFNRLRQRFLDYNGSEWQCDDFRKLEKDILEMINEKKIGYLEDAGIFQKV